MTENLKGKCGKEIIISKHPLFSKLKCFKRSWNGIMFHNDQKSIEKLLQCHDCKEALTNKPEQNKVE